MREMKEWRRKNEEERRKMKEWRMKEWRRKNKNERIKTEERRKTIREREKERREAGRKG